MPDTCHYVVLSLTGQNTPLGKGESEDYYKLLLGLWHTWGGRTLEVPGNKPDKLICNGVIVVNEDLMMLAYTYATRRTELVAAAEASAKQECRPPWMEGD